LQLVSNVTIEPRAFALRALILCATAAPGMPAHAQAPSRFAVEIRGSEPGDAFTVREPEGALVPDPDATGPHQVELRAPEPVVAFRLQDAQRRATPERCENPCSELLPGTRLRVELLDAEGESLGARNVRIEEDVLLELEAPDRGARDMGLLLCAMGVAASVVGGALVLANSGAHGGDGGAGVGLLVWLGGGLTFAIGAPPYFGNLRPDLTILPQD
jgi:hypothetical protein